MPLNSLYTLYTFYVTSFRFENLSNTPTILATQFLQKTLNRKATAQSCDWLIDFSHKAWVIICCSELNVCQN